MKQSMKESIGNLKESIECKKEAYREWLHRIQWNLKSIVRNKRYDIIFRGIVVVLFVAVFTTIGMRESQSAKAKLQRGIASEIIRFHVIANSDLDQDQAVKMKVKDAVIKALRPRMTQTENIAVARGELQDQMGFIQEVATQTLRENGFYYDVTVSLDQEEFPIKVYGDITLPAGTYEALCIRLGAAEGHNWWCIVFPSLCYVDETYSYVPDESKDQLKNLLSDEEYDSITKEEGIKIKVKFKLWEYLKKYF